MKVKNIIFLFLFVIISIIVIFSMLFLCYVFYNIMVHGGFILYEPNLFISTLEFITCCFTFVCLLFIMVKYYLYLEKEIL